MLDNLISTVDSIAINNTIPEAIILDVKQRITDWIESGGVDSDRYIENQFRVLDRFISYKITKAES